MKFASSDSRKGLERRAICRCSEERLMCQPGRKLEQLLYPQRVRLKGNVANLELR